MPYSWKIFPYRVEIEECLGRMLSWAIPRIDNRYARVFTRELRITDVLRTYGDDICIRWYDSDSIGEDFPFRLTRECHIRLRYDTSTEAMHRGFEWESCPSRWLVEKRRKNSILIETCPSREKEGVHFFRLFHEIFEILSRELTRWEYMTHRKMKKIFESIYSWMWRFMQMFFVKFCSCTRREVRFERKYFTVTCIRIFPFLLSHRDTSSNAYYDMC